jgi:hypothetical protein
VPTRGQDGFERTQPHGIPGNGRDQTESKGEPEAGAKGHGLTLGGDIGWPATTPGGSIDAIRTPSGFDWTERKDGSVVITPHGKAATVLRGGRAREFVEEVGDGDGQEVMARVTGNYKRGNERTARQHPRNR